MATVLGVMVTQSLDEGNYPYTDLNILSYLQKGFHLIVHIFLLSV